jgi:hypothetical protein
MRRRPTEEEANNWKEMYENGESTMDIMAKECAKGRAVSIETVRKAIKGVGGVIRTLTEAQAVLRKKKAEKA